MAAGNVLAVRSDINNGKRPRQVQMQRDIIDSVEAKARHSHMEFARTLIRKYGKDGSGTLCREEVRKALSDIAPSGDVSQDELDFVFKVADSTGDGRFHVSEMCTLLSCWDNYMNSQDEINLYFRRYDPDATGRLDKGQLWRLLSDLSGHQDVTRGEVDWVMRQAGILRNGNISKPELRRALALWNVHMKGKENACCTVQ